MNTLIIGGVRSGKSRYAEQLLAGHERVAYVAPGPAPEEDLDPDWAARIALHRARRPASWVTLETCDLAAALRIDAPVLVDCLGTWLSAALDQQGLWEVSNAAVQAAVMGLLDEALQVLAERNNTVLVTNEVGLGVVPVARSGRLFRDLLGGVNQQVADACDEVHLVVAGRALRL